MKKRDKVQKKMKTWLSFGVLTLKIQITLGEMGSCKSQVSTQATSSKPYPKTLC